MRMNLILMDARSRARRTICSDICCSQAAPKDLFARRPIRPSRYFVVQSESVSSGIDEKPERVLKKQSVAAVVRLRDTTFGSSVVGDSGAASTMAAAPKRTL